MGETDDHLQVAGSAGWSFARGQILRMIICKKPDPLDDHLQVAGSSRWSSGVTRVTGVTGQKEEKKEKEKKEKFMYTDGPTKGSTIVYKRSSQT